MKIKDTKLNYALNVVCRWVVGLVFLFSSFVIVLFLSFAFSFSPPPLAGRSAV